MMRGPTRGEQLLTGLSCHSILHEHSSSDDVFDEFEEGKEHTWGPFPLHSIRCHFQLFVCGGSGVVTSEVGVLYWRGRGCSRVDSRNASDESTKRMWGGERRRTEDAPA